MTENFQKKLEAVLAAEKGKEGRQPKRLLLHACCAPCSSYVLEYLRSFFAVTVFYYNPNITDEAEYRKRAAEVKRLINLFNAERFEQAKSDRERAGKGLAAPGRAASVQAFSVQAQDTAGAVQASSGGFPIGFLEGAYEPEKFLALAGGLEAEPEGGRRCSACYALRLSESARRAAAEGYDYFTTTLTISPLKDAGRLNGIGRQAAEQFGCPFLPSDFKKKNGYQRSVELSRVYGLYRQDYCGCRFSKEQREEERLRKKS